MMASLMDIKKQAGSRRGYGEAGRKKRCQIK
jgi:hypothetical protein